MALYALSGILLTILIRENKGCLNNLKLDIVFSLDESASVSASEYGEYKDTLDAVNDAISRFNIDTTNGIRVGAMAIHNETTRKVFGLNDYNSVSSIQSAISSSGYADGAGTDLSVGLRYGCLDMFGGADDRGDAANYLIYLTHGYTNTTLAAEASADCTASGVSVVIVAIETSADTTTLNVIGTGGFVSSSFICLSSKLSQEVYRSINCQWYCNSLSKGGDPASYDSDIAAIGTTFIYKSSNAKFECCGRIESWEFYAKRSGTLSLQVWRPDTGNNYKLVGVNKLYIPTNAVNIQYTYVVPVNERITVNTGDYFGWHSTSGNIIAHNDSLDSSDFFIYKNVGNIQRGSTADFTSPITESYSKASIRVNIENEDSSIWFPDTGYTEQIFDHTPVGTTIFDWSVANKDQEFLTYKYYTTPASDKSKFNYTHNEGDIKGYISLASSLTNGKEYSLTLSAEDTCAHCETGTLKVKVTNLAPRILSLPSFYEIKEDTDLSSAITLHTIQTQDDSGDTVTCSKQETVPSSTIFGVRNSGGASTIILKQNSALSFDTASEYRIKIRCQDSKNAYDEEYFKVFLRRNIPPTISNMFGYTDWVAGTKPSGSSVITPTAVDSDSTSFTYIISSCGSPPVNETSCPVEIVASSSGEIQTNMHMSAFKLGGFNVRLKISDGQTMTGPYPYSVSVRGHNDAPVIINLPLADDITITESIPPFTWLYTVQFYDINNWNPLSLTASISPSEGQTYFEITKTINDNDSIKTSSQQIDYETLTNKQFTVTFVLSDGITSITKSLTIRVENENEGLTFALSSYTLAANEGPVDTVVGDPGFAVTDTDGDAIQYTFDCGTNSRYYKMDRTTGIVSFAWDMDVDKGYSRQAVCTITAWDTGLLTATTALTITIYDINDNAPRFDKRYYTFWATTADAVGKVLGTITITDADATHPHNYIERIWIENQPGGFKYFDRNETTGEFFINKNLTDIGDGNVIDFVIYAEDYGHLKSSANITVILPAETTTTSTTTPEPPLKIMDEASSSLWITCATVTGVCIAMMILFLSCKHISEKPERTKKTIIKSRIERKQAERGRDLVFRDSGIC